METICLHADRLQFRGAYYLQITAGRTLSPVVHRHDFYEMIFILSGECVHLRNDVPQTCTGGTFFVLVPGDMHSFCSQKEKTNVIALSVRAEEMQNFLTAYSLDNSDFCRPFRIPPDLRQTLETLGNLSLFDPYKASVYKCIMGIAFTQIMETQARFTRNLPADFEEAISKINRLENAAEGVDAFARLAGYSHTQLWRLTKKYLGVSPSEYICNIRMRYAYELIAYGNAPFEEIANEVGFSSFSHFIQLIRKHFGMSPVEIRNEAQKNSNYPGIPIT